MTLLPGGLPRTKIFRMRASHLLTRGMRYRLLVAQDRPVTWWRYGEKEKVLGRTNMSSTHRVWRTCPETSRSCSRTSLVARPYSHARDWMDQDHQQTSCFAVSDYVFGNEEEPDVCHRNFSAF